MFEKDFNVIKNLSDFSAQTILTSQKSYFKSMKIKAFGVNYKDDIMIVINKNITNYLNTLFTISKDKNKDSIEEKLSAISEDKIFENDFFEIYQIMKKSLKIDIIIKGNERLKQLGNDEISRQEILFIKQLHSIVKNDSQFSFQIVAKLKKK